MSRIATFLLIATLAGCGDGDVFTLYRNSVTDPNMRLAIATFNAPEGKAYNSENCQLARDLFAAQQGVQVRYWCELGRYRKSAIREKAFAH